VKFTVTDNEGATAPLNVPCAHSDQRVLHGLHRGIRVPKVNPGLQVQSTVQVGGGLVIYAKNIGSSPLKFDQSANGLTKVYVDGNPLSQGSYQVDPVEVGKGVTCTITIPIDYSSWSGRTIEIKIFTDDGILTSFQTMVTRALGRQRLL
jgi:hypothetical protein